MELKLEHSDYAKVLAIASAILLMISIVLACCWYNDKGFSVNTIISIACAVVFAVILCYSAWMMARGTRGERMEDVEVVAKYEPGDEKKPEEPTTEYKMPKQ